MEARLFTFAVDIFRLCVWLLIVMAVFVPLERAFALHSQKLIRKSFFVDLLYYFLNSLLPKLLLVFPMAVLGWVLRRAVPGGFHAWVANLPIAVRFVCALLVAEIGFYWGHRWSHEIPFLWRFHSVHHGAEEMDWLVNTRAHPIDMVFTRLCGFVPVYALGLGQAKGFDFVSLFVLFSGTLWGFFIHANLKWRFGPLEWLIATPGFHHWHHTRSAPLDKNFAALLPGIDLLFGTHHNPRKQWPASYGIEGTLPSGLSSQLLDPLLPGKFGPVPAADR